MDDGVKGARASKKATAPEETGQKAAELLLAVLEELKASRAESAALRKLLEKVLAALAGTKETEESFAQEAIEGEAGQEGSASSLAARRVNRTSGPAAILFVDTASKGVQEGKGAQG